MLRLVLLCALLFLLGFLLANCTGWLVDALEERQVRSCVWWHSPLSTARGVSATGGVPLAQCLAVPSQLP